jgi:aspartate dehydrogenase
MALGDGRHRSAKKLSIQSVLMPRRVAIAGLGSIGSTLARALDEGVPGFVLSAIATRNAAKAEALLSSLANRPAMVSIAALEGYADLVIECAPAALMPAVVAPFLSAGKAAIVMSVGALLEREDLIDLARANAGQIIVPSGALLGLDAVTAAAQGTIHSVRMITRKPVRGLVGAPYLSAHNISIDNLKEPLKIFEGSARKAARGFPANLNVAAALSLAGIGPERTIVEIWADPTLSRNNHRIEVDADSASFSMSIANVPTENPRTGRITALSVIAYLRKVYAPLRVA